MVTEDSNSCSAVINTSWIFGEGALLFLQVVGAVQAVDAGALNTRVLPKAGSLKKRVNDDLFDWKS